MEGTLKTLTCNVFKETKMENPSFFLKKKSNGDACGVEEDREEKEIVRDGLKKKNKIMKRGDRWALKVMLERNKIKCRKREK